MKVASVVFLITAICSTVTVVAQAASGKVEGLPIKIGDTVEDVQKALGTNLEPEKMQEKTAIATKANTKTQLRLKTKGIWVFFEKGKAYTIRVDKPFSGNLDGVKLGDPANRIEKVFGPPVKRGSYGFSQTYTYYFDDITTTRLVVNQDDEIETIFFVK